MKIYLKLWSTDVDKIPVVRQLHQERWFHGVELYAVPGSFVVNGLAWNELEVPYIIHAPHFGHGFNLSLKKNWGKNKEMFEESGRFCDALGAKQIIIHLGTSGSLDESLKQLNRLGDSRLVVENKPQVALDGTDCVGVSPADLRRVLCEAPVRFCLDISHAVAYSSFHKIDVISVLKDFIALSPCHYHLSDGLMQNVQDKHMNLGKGDYDLRSFLGLLPRGAAVTLETPKNNSKELDLFIEEVLFLRDQI